MQNENLKQRFGINENGVIQKDKFELLLEDVSKNNISREQALELLKQITNLSDVQKAYLETVKEAISAIKDVQKSAMDKINVPSVDAIIRIIEDMSKSTDNLAFKEKIIEKLMELAKLMFEYEQRKNDTASKMNNDNNNFWSKLLIGVGVVAIGAVGAAATVIMNKDNK